MKKKEQSVMSASDFKAHCLEVMDQVNKSRKEVVITKRGKPVAKLVAVDKPAPTIFGILAGTVTYHGDIIEPIGEIWDAQT